MRSFVLNVQVFSILLINTISDFNSDKKKIIDISKNKQKRIFQMPIPK